MRTSRAIVGLGALLLFAGCSTASPTAMAAPVGVAKPVCTKTAATPAGQRPAVLADTTGSWYGVYDLWVGLPERAAAASGETIELKLPWVTLSGQKPSPDMGLPQVSAVRSDGPSPVTATFAEYSRTFGTGSLAFWPSTLTFPDAGCWTVTGRLKDTTVEFVVDVKAP
jgi:hypothetical protein